MDVVKFDELKTNASKVKLEAHKNLKRFIDTINSMFADGLNFVRGTKNVS